MRIYGTDHVVINNYFEGLNGTKWDAPITLTQGDAIDGSSTNLSLHYRAERVVIAYNTLVDNDQGIEIGFSNNGSYNKALSQITIANNLITGSKNSLVKIVDGKDPGNNVTWTNNLMYPTGTATILSGGTTTTSFTTAQAVNENPNLIFNDTEGIWKSTATTPLYTNTVAVANNQDIDGQTRPAPSNPGADHYSLESVRYMAITSSTVGPNAYEDTDQLSLSPIEKTQSQFIVYPNPASSIINIQSFNSNLGKVVIYGIDGRKLLDKKTENSDSDYFPLDVSSLKNGTYLLKLIDKSSKNLNTRIISIVK
jgi:poly(beta-D-mannuronate) lyase